MPARSSARRPSVSDRLRSIRAEAVGAGRRFFQLVSVDGVPVSDPVVKGEYSNVAEALDSARRFGSALCVVREWAALPDGVRVHVDSVEWLLEWHRVAGLRRPLSPISSEGRADSRGGGLSPCPAGASGASPERRLTSMKVFSHA